MEPSVKTTEEIAAHDGKDVIVHGRYRQLDVRRKQKPPAVYRGQVAIELSDGQFVLLEPSWSNDALRSMDERQQFDNKTVTVRGVLHARAPEAPDPVAALISPCLCSVRDISAT